MGHYVYNLQKSLVSYLWFYRKANAQDLVRGGDFVKVPWLVAVLRRK